MNGTQHKVFIPSGCLSFPGMVSYLKGRLSEKEMEKARLHIEKCGLCKETLDQLTSDGEIDAFSSSVETLNRRLNEQLATENKTNAFSQKAIKLMPAVRVAASILIALGILYYLFQVVNQKEPPYISGDPMLVDESMALDKPSGKAPANGNNLPVEFFLEETVIRTSGDQGDQRRETLSHEHQPTPATRLKRQESITDPDQKPMDEMNQGGMDKSTLGSAPGSHFFNPLEAMPEFPGGYDALQFYLASQLVCPQTAKNANPQARVVLTFIIDEQGQPREVSIIHGMGGGCDEETVRVIGAMPAWKPATMDGKPVSVMFTLPVKFEML